MAYKVIIMPPAKRRLDIYVYYTLETLKNRQAAKLVLADAKDTKKRLSVVGLCTASDKYSVGKEKGDNVKPSRMELLRRVFVDESNGASECTIALKEVENAKTIIADAGILEDEGYLVRPMNMIGAIVLRLTDYGWEYAKSIFSECEDKQEMKKTKIFISHATKDKVFVEKIIELLEYMGLNEKQIFCSSIPGYDVPVGTDFLEHIREQYEEYELFVIFVHSPNYYNSTVSLNEMGAAWVLRKNAVSFLLPGFGFERMNGVVGRNQISIKLDNEEIEVKDKLNQFFDMIVQHFGVDKSRNVRWEEKRDAFLENILSLKTDHPDGLNGDKDDPEVRLCFELQSSEERDDIPMDQRTKHDPSDYCIEIYNVGKLPLYIRSFGLYHNGKIIVDCPMFNQKSEPYGDKLIYNLTIQEYDSLRYYCNKEKVKKCDVWIDDVANNQFKGMMDVEFFNIQWRIDRLYEMEWEEEREGEVRDCAKIKHS